MLKQIKEGVLSALAISICLGGMAITASAMYKMPISDVVEQKPVICEQQTETKIKTITEIKRDLPYIEYNIPEYGGFKSYMGYKTLTNKSSNQYKLQTEFAYTGKYGIRMVNERYCVAIGSHFNTAIGQYFDLVLENGVQIPCIMSDLKADIHTDVNNIFTLPTKCCSEFVVDMAVLNNDARYAGSLSAVCEEWDSPVKYIRVYETNILK